MKSNFHPIRVPPKAPLSTWKLLLSLNYYRLVTTSVLVLLYGRELNLGFLVPHDPKLFIGAVLTYLGITFVNFYTIEIQKPSFKVQTVYQIILDIAFAAALTHASGGIQSGIGMLLFVPIAGSGILLSSRLSLFLAAFGSVAVLYEQLISYFSGTSELRHFTFAGLLGVIFFASSILSHFLAQRIRAHEMLTKLQEEELQKLQLLNQHIVQYLRAGVIVIDKNQRLSLMNASASRLLGISNNKEISSLFALSPFLSLKLTDWLETGQTTYKTVPMPKEELLAQFMALGNEKDASLLILLHDTTEVNRQTQQIKLAALGHLTASIAHEIRNPLSVIQQASQLLEESKANPEQTELLKMVEANTKRINDIIETILRLYRSRETTPEPFLLLDWVKTFVQEFQFKGEKNFKIDIKIDPADTQIYFDPSHLRQVLSNLCENGLRYSLVKTGAATMVLAGGLLEGQHAPFLDIIDQGPGMSPNTAKHLFEPFFTTEREGAGLGLYIARELCQMNQASLNLIPTTSGSRFRIHFRAMP